MFLKWFCSFEPFYTLLYYSWVASRRGDINWFLEILPIPRSLSIIDCQEKIFWLGLIYSRVLFILMLSGQKRPFDIHLMHFRLILFISWKYQLYLCNLSILVADSWSTRLLRPPVYWTFDKLLTPLHLSWPPNLLATKASQAILAT